MNSKKTKMLNEWYDPQPEVISLIKAEYDNNQKQFDLDKAKLAKGIVSEFIKRMAGRITTQIPNCTSAIFLAQLKKYFNETTSVKMSTLAFDIAKEEKYLKRKRNAIFGDIDDTKINGVEQRYNILNVTFNIEDVYNFYYNIDNYDCEIRINHPAVPFKRIMYDIRHVVEEEEYKEENTFDIYSLFGIILNNNEYEDELKKYLDKILNKIKNFFNKKSNDEFFNNLISFVTQKIDVDKYFNAVNAYYKYSDIQDEDSDVQNKKNSIEDIKSIYASKNLSLEKCIALYNIKIFLKSRNRSVMDTDTSIYPAIEKFYKDNSENAIDRIELDKSSIQMNSKALKTKSMFDTVFKDDEFMQKLLLIVAQYKGIKQINDNTKKEIQETIIGFLDNFSVDSKAEIIKQIDKLLYDFVDTSKKIFAKEIIVKDGERPIEDISDKIEGLVKLVDWYSLTDDQKKMIEYIRSLIKDRNDKEQAERTKLEIIKACQRSGYDPKTVLACPNSYTITYRYDPVSEETLGYIIEVNPYKMSNKPFKVKNKPKRSATTNIWTSTHVDGKGDDSDLRKSDGSFDQDAIAKADERAIKGLTKHGSNFEYSGENSEVTRTIDVNPDDEQVEDVSIIDVDDGVDLEPEINKQNEKILSVISNYFENVWDYNTEIGESTIDTFEPLINELCLETLKGKALKKYISKTLNSKTLLALKRAFAIRIEQYISQHRDIALKMKLKDTSKEAIKKAKQVDLNPEIAKSLGVELPEEPKSPEEETNESLQNIFAQSAIYDYIEECMNTYESLDRNACVNGLVRLFSISPAVANKQIDDFFNNY